MEEEPSYKKAKESATNPTTKNMCCLNGLNHLIKDCPNNSNSKKYNGHHYSKVCEQEQASAPGTNKKTSTKSNEKQSESKKHRKKHRHKSRDKVHSILLPTVAKYSSFAVKVSQVRNSLGSKYFLHLENTR